MLDMNVFAKNDCTFSNEEYEALSEETKLLLKVWISRFECAKAIYDYSSYGLKHHFEEDSGVYVNNEEFKGAMLSSGFKPVDERCQNWTFRIKMRRR